MRALRFDHFGPPSTLQLQDIPVMDLQPGEVLVEIHAASVNPSDVKNVLGNMAHTTLPRTPGRDFSGVIVSGSQRLAGTEVWGTGGDMGFTCDGSHASHIVLPFEAVQPKPQNLSMQQAATIGVAYITAWIGLIQAAQVQSGETVLVMGAMGAVGQASVQIAKCRGAKVLGTVRRPSDISAAIQSGVDVVIDLSQQELGAGVLGATDKKGVNVAIDTVGGSTLETCLGALSDRGRLIEMSVPIKDPRVSFDLQDFYRRELRLLGVDSRTLDVSACGHILETLTPFFEANMLQPPTEIAPYPLEEATHAYEHVLNRSSSGKVVLIP